MEYLNPLVLQIHFFLMHSNDEFHTEQLMENCPWNENNTGYEVINLSWYTHNYSNNVFLVTESKWYFYKQIILVITAFHFIKPKREHWNLTLELVFTFFNKTDGKHLVVFILVSKTSFTQPGKTFRYQEYKNDYTPYYVTKISIYIWIIK